MTQVLTGMRMDQPSMYDDLTREVEQFLYREARLLDERRFREWLKLFTDNARYWMGGRSNRYPKTSKAIAILDSDWYVEDDLTKENELAILDEKPTRSRSRKAGTSGTSFSTSDTMSLSPFWNRTEFETCLRRTMRASTVDSVFPLASIICFRGRFGGRARRQAR